MKKDNLKQQYRINEQIRVREVRIVGDDVESTVMPTAKALQMAEAQGVDLSLIHIYLSLFFDYFFCIVDLTFFLCRAFYHI